jgi:hypothetical protein
MRSIAQIMLFISLTACGGAIAEPLADPAARADAPIFDRFKVNDLTHQWGQGGIAERGCLSSESRAASAAKYNALALEGDYSRALPVLRLPMRIKLCKYIESHPHSWARYLDVVMSSERQPMAWFDRLSEYLLENRGILDSETTDDRWYGGPVRTAAQIRLADHRVHLVREKKYTQPGTTTWFTGETRTSTVDMDFDAEWKHLVNVHWIEERNQPGERTTVTVDVVATGWTGLELKKD